MRVNPRYSQAESSVPLDLSHVLAIQADDASAIVMLSPALRVLRQTLPNAEVTLMTSQGGSQVVPLLPAVDHLMIDKAVQGSTAGRSINPRDDVAMVEEIRSRNFSIALIFTRVSETPLRAAYACYLAGVPYRVGFAKEMMGSLLSHAVSSPADNAHQADRNLNLLQAIGISGADSRPELRIPPAIESSADELLKSAGIRPDLPYVVLAPGSEGSVNQYAPHHFAAVAHILAAQTEQQLLLVGSPGEAKTMQPVLQVASENLYGNIHSLMEKTTLPELAAIIRRASLIIANNTVSMHFADAFGCPMVILHSEAEPAGQWLPRHSSARLLSRPVVQSSVPEADPSTGMQYLDVRPEEVAVAALEMLAESKYGQQDYHRLFGYRLESERNQSSSAR